MQTSGRMYFKNRDKKSVENAFFSLAWTTSPVYGDHIEGKQLLYSLEQKRERYAIIYIWEILDDFVPKFSLSVIQMPGLVNIILFYQRYSPLYFNSGTCTTSVYSSKTHSFSMACHKS